MFKVLSLLACLGAAAGCGDACLNLAQQICACQPDQGSQDACNNSAKQQASVFSTSSADQKFCQQKLDQQQCSCASAGSPSATEACCAKLNTPEGRNACGLVITSP
jgi:hypothetical protein